MKTILFAGGPYAGLIVPGSTIAQIPKDPDGSGTGFLLRLLGRDGALYTYHLKGNVAQHVSTIHSEASLQEECVIRYYRSPQELATSSEVQAEVDLLLSDPRTFRRKDGTP